jgi:hypothetical protein
MPHHNRSARLAVVLSALALALLVIACGSGAAVAPTKIAEVATTKPQPSATGAPAAENATAAPAANPAASEATAVPAATSAPTGPQTYKVGDVIAIKDLNLVVLGWDRPAGDQFSKPEDGKQFVAVELILVNKGASAASVSSLAQMSLKDGEDQKYTVDFMASSATGASAPEGELAPGEKLRGKVGFQVPKGATGLTFVFDADIFGSGKLFVRLGDEPIALDPPAELAGETAQTTYQVGEAIKIGDLVLVVNDVGSPKGDKFNKPKDGQRFVVVDLTIENKSTKEEALSSMLQMSLKDAGGQKYTIDLGATTAAGGSTPDGKLAAGEKLRGKVGFQVPADAKDLVFVFDANVFGSGKVFVKLP